MAKNIEDLEFVQANEAATRIAEAAIVAYYMGRREQKAAVQHHAMAMRTSLDRLCEIMGLRVVDAEDVSA